MKNPYVIDTHTRFLATLAIAIVIYESLAPYAAGGKIAVAKRLGIPIQGVAQSVASNRSDHQGAQYARTTGANDSGSASGASGSGSASGASGVNTSVGSAGGGGLSITKNKQSPFNTENNVADQKDVIDSGNDIALLPVDMFSVLSPAGLVIASILDHQGPKRLRVLEEVYTASPFKKPYFVGYDPPGEGKLVLLLGTSVVDVATVKKAEKLRATETAFATTQAFGTPVNTAVPYTPILIATKVSSPVTGVTKATVLWTPTPVKVGSTPGPITTVTPKSTGGSTPTPGSILSPTLPPANITEQTATAQALTEPTFTPMPTYTPRPTLTLLPTLTPVPSPTRYPDNTPLPTLTLLPTLTPLPTP